MNGPRSMLALMAFAVLIAPVSAQTSLVWRFEPGQVYEVERRAAKQQSVELKGKPFRQESKSVWQVRLDVKAKKGEAFLVQAAFTKVQHEQDHKPDAVAVRMADALQGSVFNLLVSPPGEIADLQGYDELIKKLVDKSGPAADSEKVRRAAWQAIIPEAGLKQAFAEMLGPLPDKAVRKGDRWQREFVDPLPHFGNLRSVIRCEHEGRVQERDRIACTIETKYEWPKDETMVLFRVVKGSVETEKGEGTITFDSLAGHLVQHERSVRLRGTLTFDVMGGQQTAAFTSASDLTVRVKKK